MAGGSTRRDARTGSRRSLVVALSVAAVLVAVAVVVVVGIARDGGQSADGGGGSTESSSVPTGPPAATDTGAGTDVAAPPVAAERLSLDSRLGYAGLGPIRWGMTPAEVEAAGGREFATNEQCATGWWPDLVLSEEEHFEGVGALLDGDGRIVQITISRPGVSTISGIQVGSTEDEVRATYPSAFDAVGAYQVPTLVLSHPDGRTLVFFLEAGRVSGIAAGPDRTWAEAQSKCD